MRTPRPCALLLLLVALGLTQNCAGSHWLQVLETLVVGPDIWEPRFVHVCYVNSTQIQAFDSNEATARLQPRTSWIEQVSPKYWERETESILKDLWLNREFLQVLIRHYQHSKEEYHTLQKRFGCSVDNNGSFLRGHFHLTYYGYDNISLNENLSSWIAVGRAAQILKRHWSASGETQKWSTYLQGMCVDMLRVCLLLGKETLLRSDPPQAYVTRRVRDGGNATLKCLALGFYPPEITMTWQRDGNNHTEDVELGETRPGGDGTFQKWAAVVVPSGEELRYTCHVKHEGLPEPMTLRWETPQSLLLLLAFLMGSILGALVIGTVVIFLIWRK